MRYTMFGRTGLRVSELCLGAMIFGEGGVPKETARRILALYADAGGNFIDTADKYMNGSSERLVGELLGPDRERFVLATKYTLQTVPGDGNSSGNQRKNLVQSLEASLRRLRTDYIDVYWVHSRDALTPVDEVMRALDDQVRAGKVLYAGASNWSAWEIAQANTLADLRGWTAFAGLQSQYNLVERTAERELIPMTREFGMALTCWSPLAGGLLTGKYLPDTGDGAGGRLAGRASERIDAARERIIRVVVTIAGELGVPPSQVALAWLLHQPGMVIPMVGASQEAQARENLGAVEVSLDRDQLDRLDIASRVELGYPHDFLHRHDVRQLVYGDRHEQMDHRLAEVGRSVPGA